jgi:2-pyrone-4,6-dicarboxylate lactonase
MNRPKSPPIDRNYRTPRITLPRGACDTHFHFIGPQAQFPLKPNHTFSQLEFEDTTADDWLVMQEAMGLTRGVLVNSMMYDRNYEIVLNGLMRFPDRLRAVIVPWSKITDGELDILARAGVVSARFTNRLDPVLDERMIRRVHEHGWSASYLGIHGEARRKTILASPGRFVIEHVGHVPTAKGIDSEEFKFVLQCLDTGRCWVKLNPRFSAQAAMPYSDTLPIVRKLVAHAPNRLVWCSDWPHPQYFKTMPNDGDLVDIMADWVPDEAVRNRIFADNAAECFGFPPL